jgi:hypothetical protein
MTPAVTVPSTIAPFGPPRESPMLEFLTVAAVLVLVVIGLLVTGAWLTVRRVRRSRLVATAAHLLADGVLTVPALRLRPTPNRAAALHALRISRGHRLLRQRVAQAQAAGAYLGDVPTVLPRLETEGRRLRSELGRLIGSTTAGHELSARAESHLRTLADLTEAVSGAASVPAADASLAREAEEAALGLRLHTAAYTELMAMGTARDVDGIPGQPRANAS